jgi:hypothetical protein
MTTTTRYVGTCAVCARFIKIQKGVFVHHGYKRPGDGQILGDCFAVGMTPHEVSSSTAEAYRDSMTAYIARQEAEKAFFEQATELYYTYTYTVYHGDSRETKVGSATIKEGDPFRVVDSNGIPSFVEHKKNKIREAERQIEGATREVARMTQLIDSWKLQSVMTVEEEQERVTAEKKARREAVKAERDAKKATKSARKAERDARLQVKIDAAKKRAHALLDAVDPTDLHAVRQAYLKVLDEIKLPDAVRYTFYDEHLGRTELLRSAGLTRSHDGSLMSNYHQVRELIVALRAASR